MPFCVASEDLQFFQRYSKIEFDDIFNSHQIQTLNHGIEQKKPPAAPCLQWGFDLWRENETLKPIICARNLAQVAGQLKNLTQLRFGFSQFLGPRCYDNDTSLLYRKSFIKELLIGVCICLKPAKEAESPFFPTTAGHALFFDVDPDFFLKFPLTSGNFLFIFYADFKARFCRQEEQTPLYQGFQKLNYQHGDFLNDENNPPFARISL